MAIENMKGKVSMTGMVNSKPPKIEATDMSKIKMPTAPKQVTQKLAPQEAPKQEGLLQKIENLTNEDKAVLSAVLSPSVSNVLTKLAPELSSIIEAAGPKEENVIIPVSMFKNFAQKRYSGDEAQAVQSLITDMSGTEMEQQTVPPDTQMAELPESGVEGPLNAVDTEGEVV